jgi:hypothetical protein
MYLCREPENNGRHTPNYFITGLRKQPLFGQTQSFEGFGRASRLQFVPCENKFNIAAKRAACRCVPILLCLFLKTRYNYAR